MFEEHKEHFYYCSLVMMDEATPCITAMSDEIFKQLLDNDTSNDYSSEENEMYYKLAYAESPYLGFGYEDYFTVVNDFFCNDLSDDISDKEYEDRINEWLLIMRDVMKTLNDKKLFSESCNENIFLNAEQQPTETEVNLDNAQYLNSDNVFEIWYKDNKEDYE